MHSYDIHNPQELRRFFLTNDKHFVVMREAEWQQNFGDDSLILKSRDKVWKAQKITFETIETAWKGGIKTVLENHSETLALLTRQFEPLGE